MGALDVDLASGGRVHLVHAHPNAAGTWPTRRIGIATAIDKIVVDGYTGSCQIHGRNMGGVDSGTAPLDSGYDFSQLPMGEAFNGRIDHLAVSCELERR